MACDLLVKNGLVIDGTGALQNLDDLDQTNALLPLTPGATVVSWRRTSEGSRRHRPQQRDSRRPSG
jgi:hypothetical protein